ncbi:MAG: hypothetical protein WAO73_07925 [Zwartia sp.]
MKQQPFWLLFFLAKTQPLMIGSDVSAVHVSTGFVLLNCTTQQS